MNAIKTLLAVSVLAATGAAHAAVYNVSGTQTSISAAPAVVTYPGGVPAFTGTLDDSTGAYSFSFGTFTAHTDVFSGFYVADITTVGQVLSGTGNGVVTKAGTSTCTGSPTICSATPTAPTNGTLTFSVAGSTITGTLNTTQDTAGGTSTAVYSFSGSAPAVPVPAAAWLFGSGLLGLAGTARRRRAA